MFEKSTIFSGTHNFNAKLLLVLLLSFVAAAWRFAPLMPHVFFGDDLSNLLAFKDGLCGTVVSQLLTSVCVEKFRPVSSIFLLLQYNLFNTIIAHYMVANVLLQSISSALVFVIAYRLSEGNSLVALSIAIAVAVSRFAAYQVTQVIGPIEGLALLIFLSVIYSIIRADSRKEDAWRWGWTAVLLSFLLIYTHERYILITGWLCVAFILLPNFRALSRKQFAALLIACVALPVFYVTYKVAVLNSQVMVGTGGTHLDFDLRRILSHVRQAVFSLLGFNEGPEYLIGVRLISLARYPAWVLATILACSVVLSTLLGAKGALAAQAKPAPFPAWVSIRWLILLTLLTIFMLIPPVSTIRLEQRWLFAPFVLMLLVVAWAVGQTKSKAKLPIWTLIVILAASSILLDSIIMKHFNQVFFVSSARFADMAKRDIADKYAGASSDLDLLVDQSHCNWSLLNGGFFRIYGGQARKLKCVSINDYVSGSKLDSGKRVFAESSPGHLSDITDELQARIQFQPGRVSFDFLSAFPKGSINNTAKVATPSERGVLVMPWVSMFGAENTMTFLPGFSYRFDAVLIERDSQLRFGLSMIYPVKEPMRSIVYVIEHGEDRPEVLFSREINPPRLGETLSFIPVSISLAAYSGKQISLIFAAEPTGNDTSGQWLGYSNPQIIVSVEH
jgi:hypothetical protein